MLGGTTEFACPASTRLFVVSTVAVVVGALCIAVGIGLPYWHVGDTTHDGVFHVCRKDLEDCELHKNDDDVKYRQAPFIRLLWGLVICGIVCLVLGLFLFTCYPCRMTVDHCKVAMAIFIIAFLLVAVVCILAAMIVYLDWFSRYDPRYQDNWDLLDDVGVAWYITLIGVILLIMAIICFGLSVFFLLYYSSTKVEELK